MSTLKVNEIDTKTGTTITVAAGKTLAGTDIIGETQIAADAVTTSKILDDNVTYGKLQDTTTANRVLGAVGAGTIGEVEVATDMVANNAITAAKISGASAAAAGTFLRQDGTFTAIDTASILNDIATLALQQATQNNQAAYNLANAFVDQYEDSTGLDVLTDTMRNTTSEYMSSIGDDMNILFLINSNTTGGSTVFTDTSPYGRTITAQGSPDHSTGRTLAGFGTTSIKLGGPSEALYAAASSDFNIQADFTLDWWMDLDRFNSDSEGFMGIGTSTATGGDDYYLNISNSGTGTLYVGVALAQGVADTGYNAFNTSDWFHVAVVRSGSAANNAKFYVDGYLQHQWTATATMPSSGSADGIFFMGHSGNRYMDGYIQEVRLTKDARTTIVGDPMYISSGTSFTPATAPYSITKTNATGNYTSTTETSVGTVSKMGIVVLYKNAYGTATLDTDLVAQVSSNGGTNYTSAPLTAMGTFSTGILMAKSNDITITNTGTAPKYKISFANQVSATKETQVYGVALLY